MAVAFTESPPEVFRNKEEDLAAICRCAPEK
jgi:hypothetical protein